MSIPHVFTNATDTDIPRLVEIGQTCFPNAPEWNAPKFMISRWWRRIIYSSESKVIVLKSDHQIQSFIIYVDNEQVWNRLEKSGPNAKLIKIATAIFHPRILKSQLSKRMILKSQKAPNTGLPKSSEQPPAADDNPHKDAQFFAGLMGVDPSFRGQGIGRNMLLECEKFAAARGTRLVKIYVDPRNSRAQSIYMSMGYSHAGRVRNSLMMVKKIS